jgi:hypothetical protein
MTARVTSETLFLKYEFSKEERLEMGANLAQAHNRMEDIEAEESVMKAQIRDRKAGVEQTIGTLSRNLGNGYEMRNIQCATVYDDPHVGEVSFYRKDTGELAKTRRMTESEMQMDLPLAGEYVVVPPEKSSENIANFFDAPAIVKAAADGEEPAQENADDLQEGEEYDPFTDPDPAASKDAIKAEHDAAFEGEPPATEPKKRGRPAKPRGFDGPTNSSEFLTSRRLEYDSVLDQESF